MANRFVPQLETRAVSPTRYSKDISVGFYIVEYLRPPELLVVCQHPHRICSLLARSAGVIILGDRHVLQDQEAKPSTSVAHQKLFTMI
jgi:hypothetical protein